MGGGPPLAVVPPVAEVFVVVVPGWFRVTFVLATDGVLFCGWYMVVVESRCMAIVRKNASSI